MHLPGLVAAMTALPRDWRTSQRELSRWRRFVRIHNTSPWSAYSHILAAWDSGGDCSYQQRNKCRATCSSDPRSLYFTLGILHLGGVGKICERNGEGSTRKGGKLELLGWESCQVKCLLLYSHDHVIKAIRALLMVLWFVDPGLDSTLYEPSDPVRHATNPFE